MSDKDSSDDKEVKGLSDVLKKVLSTGVSAAFMTEDAVRNVLQDLPLPKDVIQGLVQNAKSTKDEFVGSIKSELKQYLDKIDLSKEIDRVLDNYDIEINAKLKFKKKNTKKGKSNDK